MNFTFLSLQIDAGKVFFNEVQMSNYKNMEVRKGAEKENTQEDEETHKRSQHLNSLKTLCRELKNFSRKEIQSICPSPLSPHKYKEKPT